MRIFYLLTSSVMLLSAVSCSNGGKTTTPENPFFADTWTENYGIPPFEKIKDAHFMPAIEEGIVRHNKEIEEIVNNKAEATFENTILAYTGAGQFLNRVTAVFGNLTESDLTEERSALQEKINPMLTTHYNSISLNEGLFTKIKSVYDNQANMNLTAPQARLLKKVYDNFARNGANLDAAAKTRYKELCERETVLTMKYGNNLLKENAAFSLVVDNEKNLAGLPESSIAAAAELAKTNNQEGKWMFNLSYPSYFPLMTYAQNRDLRKQMFEGYSQRGFRANENNNEAIITELANLRVEKANLLGFESQAAYILDKNMAKDPNNVYQLIETLWNPSVKLAKEELADMKKIMAKDGVNKFEAWDWWYYADKVRAEKYALDENMTKPYFEINNVRNGVFTLLNKLFGIKFETIENAPKYHPDMTAYKVTEADGTMLGILTLDMHPRSTKRGGAWCSSFREQSYDKNGNRIHPIVPVVCNFTAPTANAPALLSIDEASTFFHEMGHAVQGLLQDVKIEGLAGTSQDFVELPSQILEEWAMNPEFLKMYAKHYQTGEVIPDDIIEKMQKSSKFNKGFEMTEFLAAAYLDMDYHALTQKQDSLNVTNFETASMAKLGLIEEIIPRYRSTYFTHIFSGGYAAGYYGYKWADVIVADAFHAFVETGDIFNPELSKKLRYDILTPWGTTGETDMYLAFRGKEADMKYLMERIF